MSIEKGKLNQGPVDDSEAETIQGSFDKYKDFEMDPKGYFLIRLDRDNQIIEAGHCSETNKVDFVIRGKSPQEIYTEAIKRNLVGNMHHAAYLGKELCRAFFALKENKEYVQDEE